jgi:hypothetical protein
MLLTAHIVPDNLAFVYLKDNQIKENQMFFSRKLFVFCFAVFLSAAIFFTGCSMDNGEWEDTGFIPLGLWTTDFDRYNITDGFLDYFAEGWGEDWPPVILKGSIARAVDFSKNAGVLIIRVNEASSNTVGNYTAVYYRAYTGSSVRLANAIGPAPDFSPIEAASLTAAESLFTAENSNVHVIDWGVVSPYILNSK